MLSFLSRFAWDFRQHPGGGAPAWCYFSPGVVPDYEPLWWPEWTRRDWSLWMEEPRDG